MSRFINPVPQFWLNDGTLAVSGKFKFFENGDYSTLKNTYSQSNNTIANTNPVTLDGQGRLPPCFGEGLYSVKFYAYDNAAIDNLGTLQWTRDDVNLSELTGQFSDWNPLLTYNNGDIAKGSDGRFYQLFNGPSQGNDPISASTFWEKIVFVTEYNANRTYIISDNIVYNGYFYRSNANGNIGNTPPASQWDNLTFNNSITGNLAVSGTVTAASYVGGNLSKTTDVGINKTAKKTSTTNRASTTTLAADPDLSVVTEASTYYAVKALIHWINGGTTANGIKIRINGAAVQSLNYIANTNTSTANAAPTANENGGVPGGFVKMPNTAGSAENIIIDAIVLSSGIGTIYIEWSQAVSDVTATGVGVGSYLSVVKL